MIPIYKVKLPDDSYRIGYCYCYRECILTGFHAYKDHQLLTHPKFRDSVDITNYFYTKCETFEDFVSILSEYRSYYHNYKWHYSSINDNEALIHHEFENIYFIFVEAATSKEYILPKSFAIRNCTYYKAVDGQYIFDWDIVRMAPRGLLSSIYGIVYLNSKTMQYRVKLFQSELTHNWEETVKLADYQWEAVDVFRGDGLLPEEVEKQIYRVNILELLNWFKNEKYTSRGTLIQISDGRINHSDYINPLCKLSSISRMSNISDNSDNSVFYGYPIVAHNKLAISLYQSIIRKKINKMYTGFDDKYIASIIARTYDPDRSLFQLNSEDIGFIEEQDKNIATCIKNLVRPRRIFDISESNIHRFIATTSQGPLYEGDKVISVSQPSLYGYVRYLPSKAKYVVEIPENLISRDEIFDGYMNLIDNDSWNFEKEAIDIPELSKIWCQVD